MNIMVEHFDLKIMTKNDYDVAYIGSKVKEIVDNSKISNGIVSVITAHTSTGILVTEPLECIVSDLEVLLRSIVDDDAEYSHAHFLSTYGRTSANATGHLRSILTGNNCLFPIRNGKMLLGAAQDILLMEFDGPQERRIFIEIIGE